MAALCLYELARRTLGMGDDEWSTLLRDQGGVARAADLYDGRPETVRAGRQMLDVLLVRGFRSSHVLQLSPDYLLAIFRLGRERGLSDDEFRALAIGYGHHPLWNIMTMDGRVFQALVGHFRGLGCEMPDLRRSWMTDARSSVLQRMQLTRGLSEAALAGLLRDLGGGVFRLADLDETGFDRMLISLESKPGRA